MRVSPSHVPIVTMEIDSLLACDCSGAKADYVSLCLYNQIHDQILRQLPADGVDTAVGICYRVER